MTIKPDSVNTNNAQRDGHLKSPDFFNTKQYPTIEFTSTSVAPVEGGFEVTGNLTFHGETKPLTFVLKGGKTAEMKGVQRHRLHHQLHDQALRFRRRQEGRPADARRRRVRQHQLRGDQEVSRRSAGSILPTTLWACPTLTSRP